MRKLATLALFSVLSTHAAAEEQSTQDIVNEALSAAHPEIAAGATVMNWEGNVLRGGDSDWVCYPTPPGRGAAKCPMCLDRTWRDLVSARSGNTEFKPKTVGIAYMLAGDCPVSNTDPNAKGPTPDNQWINGEGPHLMIVIPDATALEGLSTDPYGVKPYVMWKGTPFAHIMVPTAGN